jgi:glycosyltransferase involved in cell wall biosynthesis
MKILQINTTVNTGSTGRIAEEIGQTFLEQNHKSFIAYKNAGPNGSSSNLIKIGNSLDVYLHGIKTRVLDRHGFGSKGATQDLVGEIEKINPDVVGLHNLHGYYLNIEVLFNYLKRRQKPIVWTLHDCWPFTGHCSFFDYVSCMKWKTECNNCPLSDKYPASWVLDRSTQNFYQKKQIFTGLKNLTIVTPSHWLAEIVKQSFLSEYPVKVINNGIDLDQFRPVDTKHIINRYNLARKKILLGVASVWDRRKGLKYFIELAKNLDDSYKIILIGLSEKKVQELPENIIGIQRTENIDELVSFYSAADAFINPTLVDNFPTTNIEALACGTPVITFDTGGSPEAIDQETGKVVNKGSSDQLYQAVLQVATTQPSTYRKKCRKRAIEYYSKKDRYEDYLALYDKILNKRQCGIMV